MYPEPARLSLRRVWCFRDVQVAGTVTWDMSRLAARLNDAQRRQVPFATALALTRVAQAAREEIIRAEMPRSFDRPTPYTLRATFVERARKDRLYARVLLRGSRAESSYLRAQIEGGKRALKSYERKLLNAGLLPAGFVTIPGAGAKLNGYGNIPGSRLMQMLSDLKIAEGWAGATQNRSAATTTRKRRRGGNRYFVARPGGHLAPGVYIASWKPGSREVKPFLLFVEASYRQRLDWQGIVTRVARQRFPDEFGRALAQALATAR
jgi:hypothetical protein